MYPIQEQGHKRGIGHGLESFLQRFDAICQEHLKDHRAKSFAFIFYDFADNDLRKILKDQRVFAELDRLSGTQLSIFYLNTGSKEAVNRFNTAFLGKLGVIDKATLSCVIFFTVRNNGIEDIAIAQLDNADLVHGFQELYGAIERYIETGVNQAGVGARALKCLKAGGILVGVVVFKEALKGAVELIVH
jgi:hypothetical protein